MPQTSDPLLNDPASGSDAPGVDTPPAHHPNRGRRQAVLVSVAFLAIALLAFGTSGCGGDAPGLEVSPTTLDWGRVRKGTNPTLALTVTNHTQRDVQIVPNPNCGCLGLGPNTRRMLAPGERLDIPLVLISLKTGGLGPLKGKWLDINSNDAAIESIRIPIVADIYLPYEVELAFHKFGRLEGEPSDLKPRVTTIRPIDGNQLEVLRMDVGPKDLLNVTHHKLGSDIEIRFAVNPAAERDPLRFGVTTQVYLQLTAPDGAVSQQMVRIECDGFWARPRPTVPR